MVWRRWMIGLLLVPACAADSSEGFYGEGGSYMDEDFPPWSCQDDTTTGGPCETESGAAAPTCVGSDECAGDQVCFASFDGEIGSFSCQFGCIGNLDDTQWCFDDAACCDSTSSCVRGFCMPGGTSGESDGGATSTGSEGSTTAADSETTGGSSTGGA